MRYILLVGFLFSFNNNLFAQVFDGFQTINHNQIDRRFYLYVPNNYSENLPTPIVFNFHGGGGDPISYMNYTSDMRGLAWEIYELDVVEIPTNRPISPHAKCQRASLLHELTPFQCSRFQIF